MRTLLLAAGGSQAYADAGQFYPKNLVEIAGKPLIQHVIERLGTLATSGELIAMVPKAENDRFHTAQVIHLLAPSARVLEVAEPTSGAACTALLAVEHVDDGDPLLIVNGDQIVEADLTAIVDGFAGRALDGGVVVFEAVHPRWSYVKCDREGLVVEAAEKRPISNLATAGLYWWAQGRDFVASAKSMIRKDAHVDGRFYVCPAYNEMVLGQRRVGVHRIDRSSYHSFTDPQGVALYEAHLERVTQ